MPRSPVGRYARTFYRRAPVCQSIWRARRRALAHAGKSAPIKATYRTRILR